MSDFSKALKTEYEGELPFVRVRPRGEYKLGKTMECGQCFRWERVTESKYSEEYVGVAHGRLLSVASDGDELIIFNCTAEDYENIFGYYFAAEEDYDKIDAEILASCGNPALAEAQKCGRGIRILHQDAWESLCSFIISQNNNIPRIKKIIDSLSRALGERIDSSLMTEHGGGDREYCSFPSAQALLSAGEDFIFSLKTGFRAKYIIDAADKWCDGTVDEAAVREIEALDEALGYLCRIKGVGLKVASCALLFGFGRYDPFPVDVWMKRVLSKYFDADFDPASLGRYAGVAQQYLFDYERSLGNGRQ